MPLHVETTSGEDFLITYLDVVLWRYFLSLSFES